MLKVRTNRRSPRGAGALRYEVAGKGTTLVLIHGVAGSLRIFDPVYRILAKQFRVIRLDLLGYGFSPKPKSRYDLAAHTEAIRDVIQRTGTSTYVVVGLSMGANLALEIARRWPDEVEGIVCIGLPYFRDAEAARRGLLKNFWTRLTIERPILARVFIPVAWKVLRRIPLLPRIIHTIYTPVMVQESLRCRYLAFRSSMRRCMVELDQDALLAASAHRKRLFIHGVEDQWAPCAPLRAALSGSFATELIELADCEHNTVLVEPNETAALIRNYVNALA